VTQDVIIIVGNSIPRMAICGSVYLDAACDSPTAKNFHLCLENVVGTKESCGLASGVSYFCTRGIDVAMTDPGNGYHDPAAVVFHERLNGLIDYFRAEYNLTYSSAIGVLTMTSYELCREANDRETED
jgi:hypothetical protein